MLSFRNLWQKTCRAAGNHATNELTSSFVPWLKNYSQILLQSQKLVSNEQQRWGWLQSLRSLGQPSNELNNTECHRSPSATASDVGTLGWKAQLAPDLQTDFTTTWPGISKDVLHYYSLIGAAPATLAHSGGGVRSAKKGKQQSMGRPGQMKKTPLPRSIVQVLDTGMRPGMMPQTHGPVASGYRDAAKLEQLNKAWHRRGLGRNKVLPGATWSLRRLKLDRAEASKLERQHRASVAAEHTNLNWFAPLARTGMVDVLESGVVSRILAGHHDDALAAKLFEWAKQQQWHTADARTYAELIRIMAWAGEADAAEELLQEMHLLAGSPDGDTFLVVLLVYYRMGRPSEAIRLLRDALKLGYRPDRKIVRVSLYLCLKCGTASEQALLQETLSLNRDLIGPADDLEDRLAACCTSPPQHARQ